MKQQRKKSERHSGQRTVRKPIAVIRRKSGRWQRKKLSEPHHTNQESRLYDMSRFWCISADDFLFMKVEGFAYAHEAIVSTFKERK